MRQKNILRDIRLQERRQKFRTTTVEENRADIRVIYDLIRKHRPDAKLICALTAMPGVKPVV